MRPRFHPRLANDPFGDPCLFIPFGFESRAFMVDLGEAPGLAPRDLLRTTHAFVTHTHMDHFAGFDQTKTRESRPAFVDRRLQVDHAVEDGAVAHGD